LPPSTPPSAQANVSVASCGGVCDDLLRRNRTQSLRCIEALQSLESCIYPLCFRWD
jgi:hypothetical protein